MSEVINQINQVSGDVEARMKRKSAFGLPIRPSEQGMRPEDIKRAFYAVITGASDSVLAEIKRVIQECNNVISNIESANGARFETIETNITQMQQQIIQNHNDFIQHGGSKTYSSFSAFPAIGEENLLYIDGQKNQTYIFDKISLTYKCVGNEDIDYIDGGTNENE